MTHSSSEALEESPSKVRMQERMSFALFGSSSRSAREEIDVRHTAEENQIVTVIFYLQIIFTVGLLLLCISISRSPILSGVPPQVDAVIGHQTPGQADESVQFSAPQLPLIALFTQWHLRRMDALARMCNMERHNAVQWRDEPRDGRPSVNYEHLLRVDSPGIQGSIFDSAVDFRYDRQEGSNLTLSSFRCRTLYLGYNFTFFRSLPMVAQQPPCPLLYAASSYPSSLPGSTEQASGSSSSWGSISAAAAQPVREQAEWGKGDCVDGWAVRQVEEMRRTGGETGLGGGSGSENGRGSQTDLRDGENGKRERSTGGGSVENDTLKVIAIVFPQFHTIQENDLFWGRNFTEWDNLKRSFFSPASFRPIPHPLASTGGYYNLLSLDHRRRMALTARTYGIHGFCYHHYWFGCNRTLLEQPLLRLLEDGEPDLPFCLVWANEEWSRRWGGKVAGGVEAVLVPQTYECEECWRQHFLWLLPFFKHKNYIKVDGKPMFQIYHLRHIPVPTRRAMLQLWQQLAVEYGLPGLHLVECLTQHVPVQRSRRRGRLALAQADSRDRTELRGDAASNSMPSSGSNRERMKESPGLVHAVMEYAPNYGKWTFQPAPTEKLHPVHYRGEYVAWDNSPRHAADQSFLARVDVHDDPVHLEARLTARMRLARADLKERHSSDASSSKEAYFFVTAWNEWGEGNALEPNNIYGFGNLNAVARAYVRSREPSLQSSEVLKRLKLAVDRCDLVVDARDFRAMQQGAENDTEGLEGAQALFKAVGDIEGRSFSLIPKSGLPEGGRQCSLLAQRLDYTVVEHLVNEGLL